MSLSYVDVGRRLKAWRQSASMKAEDVADQLGLSRAAVYRLERGEIVKVEVLEKVAALLNVSLALLMGVDVEYYPTAVGFFARMLELEQYTEQILAHFEPVSFLLTSAEYPNDLKTMLLEATPSDVRLNRESAVMKEVDAVIDILRQRKSQFARKPANIVNLIGTREIERFLHVGLVGRLNLAPAVHRVRIEAAKREVLHMAELMDNEPMGVQMGVVDDTLPPFTFQIFRQPDRDYVAVSAFRLGELPNIRSGVATVTASGEAVILYKKMMADLWQRSRRGREGAKLLRKLAQRR